MFPARIRGGMAVCALALAAALPMRTEPQSTATGPAKPAHPLPGREVLQYQAEWRLVNAGHATLTWDAPAARTSPGWRANLRLRSAGLVDTLYKIRNEYTASLDGGLCAQETVLIAREGSKHRDIRARFDTVGRMAFWVEKDLDDGKILKEESVAIPGCAHDVLGGLYRLRATPLPVGQSIELPVSDGKKSVRVRVEAQRKETVETPIGEFSAVRYEVFLFKGVLYRRDARLFVWLTDDDRRLPVQIRVQMRFLLGTVTLQLTSQERV